MRSLVDQIEQHIKEMLSASEQGVIEIQRSLLAQIFSCAPSQINYVLSTRFGVDQGYLVESRRGGAGYVRITRLSLDLEERLRELIEGSVARQVSQQVGEGLLGRLREENFLTPREELLLRAVIQRESLPLELPERDLVRSSILRSVLLTILRDDFPGGDME